MSTPRRTVLWLGAYAAAMAWVEAAVVVYLRRLYYSGDLLTLFPMRVWRTSDLLVELAREVATIVMIFAVALLAVPGRARRVAAFLFVFGVWDLCYYLWLKLALGWPVSWADWDILFLIPWAWLAPWSTPAVAALLFALWGGSVLAAEAETTVPRRAWLLSIGGLTLMLASFLEPALPLLGEAPNCRAVRAFALSVGGVPPGHGASDVGALPRTPARGARWRLPRGREKPDRWSEAAASGGCSSEPRHSFRASSRYGLLKRAVKPCCR